MCITVHGLPFGRMGPVHSSLCNTIHTKSPPAPANPRIRYRSHCYTHLYTYVEVRTENEGLSLFHLSLNLVVQVKDLNWLLAQTPCAVNHLILPPNNQDPSLMVASSILNSLPLTSLQMYSSCGCAGHLLRWKRQNPALIVATVSRHRRSL